MARIAQKADHLPNAFYVSFHPDDQPNRLDEGHGGYATVYQCRLRSHAIDVAVKVPNVSRTVFEDARFRKVRVLSTKGFGC